ncbi:MAG TPA: hypothetical protein VFP19_00915 [Candidatus Limnocylindrales bacterium]|nr:hypothetical protein [Candidatus Limnocylindrales bacterium]
MPEVRVVAIEVATPGRRDDPHPAALQLADGRQVSAARVITNLRYGVETYVVQDRDGARIQVRAVGPCPRCGLTYLRADEAATTSDRLMRLPRSPFGTPIVGGR